VVRLATFVPPNASKGRPGIIIGDKVLDFPALIKVARLNKTIFKEQNWMDPSIPYTMVDLLAKGSSYIATCSAAKDLLTVLANGGVAWPLKSTKVLTPIERPPSIRDFMAFEEHIKTLRSNLGLDIVPEWYETPVFYFTNAGSVYGPLDKVPYPNWSKNLDYELEIACVIGEGGINILQSDAEKHIGGFMIYNDWSARDFQGHEMRIGLGPAKGKDFAQSLGPCIVTLDELQDKYLGSGRYDLSMSARVNGQTYSVGNFKDIFWTFPQMIEHASRNSYIYPGDIFGSGTVGGGCLAEIGLQCGYKWLKPGDVVELEIERLGVLTNVVGRDMRHNSTRIGKRPAYLTDVTLSV